MCTRRWVLAALIGSVSSCTPAQEHLIAVNVQGGESGAVTPDPEQDASPDIIAPAMIEPVAIPGDRPAVDDIPLVTVPRGALPEMMPLTIESANLAPSGNLGRAWEIGPSGVTLREPATITFKVPPGSDVTIARVENGHWIPLRVQIRDLDFVTGYTNHFSIYGLVATRLKNVASQADRYAEACDVDRSAVSERCSPTADITIPAPNVSSYECAPRGRERAANTAISHLACVEAEIGTKAPGGEKVTTFPCTPCLRDCATQEQWAITVSDDINACMMILQVTSQTNGYTDYIERMRTCLSRCSTETIPPTPSQTCPQKSNVYYVTPSSLDSAGDTIAAGAVWKGSVPLVKGLKNPSGLAFDKLGNLYFGERHQQPVRVFLKKRAPDGTITDLGKIVDTTNGLVDIDWAFYLAISPDNEIVFNTPRIISFDSTRPRQQSSIRTLDGAELVRANGEDLVGIAFDEDGNLYFGKKTSPPIRIELHRRPPTGKIINLGQVVDTSTGGVTAGWTFDIAVPSIGDVYYTHPMVTGVPMLGRVDEDGVPLPDLPPAPDYPGSIRKLGGGVVIGDLPNTGGLAVDVEGSIYFGVTTATAPYYQGLKKRSADGSVKIVRLVRDSSHLLPLGAWNFSVLIGPP